MNAALALRMEWTNHLNMPSQEVILLNELDPPCDESTELRHLQDVLELKPLGQSHVPIDEVS